ncbi:MAG: heme NO-binding domain-containing protein [Bacteroidota bacterium]
MKGIIFTEFLDMVEEKFSYQMVDKLLTTTDLPSEGIYTSVGTYSHAEIINLIVTLSKNTNIPVTELSRIFGTYLFRTLAKIYPHFIKNLPDAFTYLMSVDNYIHVEVQKLYPDAELPHFDIERPDKDTLIMTYTSVRKMADLAFGLIEGCMEYYGENVVISQIPLNNDGSVTQFTIVRK